ncbi:glycoside hydrolase 5 family protein [Muricoccus vinaceus]|uniref:Mannan endo-1,4-beta-mannosidase n=1 Tax=Muricoccus vinaceus TaxID=424704 RepID=A0ABV6INC0_9PROT
MTELPWIERAAGAPYFVTAQGEPWTPIGQNDAISWPELEGLFRRRDLPGVERHLRHLRDSGVTCLRLMLEYAQGNHRFLERPAGRFVPAMVQLWDDLFRLCERVGMRVLLTPFDTFFTWVRWRHHPYNAANGGPCSSRTRLLVCPETREFVKARLAFATRRWGGSGVIFAWDLWNEMHPAQAENRHGAFAEFIDDVGPFLRNLETELHGRAHLQCVSVFGPELLSSPAIADPIFRHPRLDFASSHFYESGTIDHPADTVAPALAVGRLTRDALGHITDLRPFLDSEHGPIHSFKDRHSTLPEEFDDEYFRHIQWAHLASGGAGGGMRWPNRSPHVLTPGMRTAQAALSRFLPLVDWPRFRRRNISDDIGLRGDAAHVFGCGDAHQAVAWLLRPGLEDAPAARGKRLLHRVARGTGASLTLTLPGLDPGAYEAVLWDTRAGRECGRLRAVAEGPAGLALPLRLSGPDLALAIRPI